MSGAIENFPEQFRQLVMVARRANAFVFNGGWKYVGPIRPVGIVRQTSNDSTPIPKRKDGGLSQDYLVLAEHVPLEFTMGDDVCGDEPYATGIVLATLTDNCEVLDWSTETRTVGSLQAIHWCSDGTMESACAESSGGRFTWRVVFRSSGVDEI
jgi:hypothetical protein